MKITSHGTRILLQGVKDHHTACQPVKHHKLQGLLKNGSVIDSLQLWPLSVPTKESIAQVDTDDFTQLPVSVKTLVEEFSHLFAEPTALPPRRVADHSIPLISRAQPVS